MPPEEIPEDREQSYPCNCGGSRTQSKENPNVWECNICSTVKYKPVATRYE